MKIVFTGDVFLGGELTFTQLDKMELPPFYIKNDLRVINLEAPFGIVDKEARKSSMISHEKDSYLLRLLAPNIVTLANNHIQDGGEVGLQTTLRVLSEYGIKVTGAGMNINEAATPVPLLDNVFLLAYCSYSPKYLSKVKIASDNAYGVLPLTVKQVKTDIEKLHTDSKVILSVHWGPENVSFPPAEVLKLAKELLDIKQILFIVGHHPHKYQGYVRHNNKFAFLSLGNFLFPNFYIHPGEHAEYYESIAKPDTKWTTYDYHFVGKLTLKKWRRNNRISLLIKYDFELDKIEHEFVIQNEGVTTVKSLPLVLQSYHSFRLILISLTYRLPEVVYKIISKTESLTKHLLKLSRITIFLIRQRGVRWTIERIRKYNNRNSGAIQ